MSWYYVENGNQTGPFNEDEFNRLIQDGKISAETLVWRAGMETWQEYGAILDQDINRHETDDALDIALQNPESASVFEKLDEIAQVQTVCAECGNVFPENEMIRYKDVWICAACKPIFIQKMKEGIALPGIRQYAGFWIRFVAKFIDGIILSIVNVIVSAPINIMFMSESDNSTIIVVQVLLLIFQTALAVTYNTWFIGKYAATPGKMACRLKVITETGGKVTYSRALGRHFAELISSIILLIGYIMAAFDDEKRALHDRICDTRVVKA